MVLSRLHTDGPFIKDSNGNVIQLTGPCWMDFNLDKAHIEGPGADFLDAVDLRLQAHKNIGANCIRVSMNQSYWVNGGKYGVTPAQYQAQLDRIVETCNTLDIYVYFCLHLGSGGSNVLQQALMDNHNYKQTSWAYGWLDFITLLADRYKSYGSFIGIQFWAEPAWGSQTDYNILAQEWASLMADSAQTLHASNPDALAFCPSAGYYTYKCVSDYFLANPLPEPTDGRGGIVYAWQDYYLQNSTLYNAYQNAYVSGDWAGAKAVMEYWMRRRAFKMTLTEQVTVPPPAVPRPTMMTEDGFSLSRPVVNGAPQPWEIQIHAAKDWYDLFKKYQQGWSQWVWWTTGQDLGFMEADMLTPAEPTGTIMAMNLSGKVAAHLLTVKSNTPKAPFSIR